MSADEFNAAMERLAAAMAEMHCLQVQAFIDFTNALAAALESANRVKSRVPEPPLDPA